MNRNFAMTEEDLRRLDVFIDTARPASMEIIDDWKTGGAEWKPLYLLRYEQLEAAVLYCLRQQYGTEQSTPAYPVTIYEIVEEAKAADYTRRVRTARLAKSAPTLLRKNTEYAVVEASCLPSAETQDKMLSAKKAAESVGFTEQQIVGVCARGEIQATSVPGLGWCVSALSLDEWITDLRGKGNIGIADAAAYPGAPSEPTIRRLCASGEIPGAEVIGKTWIFPMRAFERYLSRR